MREEIFSKIEDVGRYEDKRTTEIQNIEEPPEEKETGGQWQPQIKTLTTKREEYIWDRNPEVDERSKSERHTVTKGTETERDGPLV